jgi:hypothetical protein
MAFYTVSWAMRPGRRQWAHSQVSRLTQMEWRVEREWRAVYVCVYVASLPKLIPAYGPCSLFACCLPLAVCCLRLPFLFYLLPTPLEMMPPRSSTGIRGAERVERWEEKMQVWRAGEGIRWRTNKQLKVATK